jgi:required for meiotic nuclear division protein 1
MYKVQSRQIAQQLSIREIRKNFTLQLLYSDSDELFYKISDTKFVYIFQFGIVSYFNLSEVKIKEIERQLNPFGRGTVRADLIETIDVSVKENTLKVLFDSVTIPQIKEEMVRLIMLHTSQSVALDRYTEITEHLLEEATKHTDSLERIGRLRISSSKLKKFIGRTLNIKNRISENLYIFDSPDDVWEDEQLEKLDRDLKITFDLKNRYRNIQDRITIIKENLELFKDIWNHKESSTLEWIIIILIVIEVIDLFVTKVF